MNPQQLYPDLDFARIVPLDSLLPPRDTTEHPLARYAELEAVPRDALYSAQQARSKDKPGTAQATRHNLNRRRSRAEREAENSRRYRERQKAGVTVYKRRAA